MFKLSFVVLALLFCMQVFAIQSPHGAKLGIKCDVCHTTGNWSDIKKNAFDHSKTQFPLVGQHKTLDCRKCHVDLVFSNAKKDCNSCHKDVHQGSTGRDCDRCHTPKSWIVENIKQIHDQSAFPLRGQHARTDCKQCHKSASQLRFDRMGTECVDCHLKDYNSTTNPSHSASKFPKDCILCHNENDFKSGTFNHDNTGFPLKGAHAGLDCNNCHQNGFKKQSTACVSCHQKDYNATTNPNHVTAKFSTECQTCHNVTSWKPSTFNHNTSTSFPLTGGHVGVDCIKCHTNGYTNTATACVSCHLKDYNATTNPNHVTAKFSTECQTCHTMTSWKPSTFNHNTSTTFPLTGGHVGVDCIKCHTNGYTNTASTCVSCHLKDYNATTSPNHVTAKFSTECQTCHNVTAWKPSTFNHNTSTTFPLTGGHVGVDCIKCHTNGYTNTASTCVSCHLKDYNATTNPNHVTAKFSTECQTCHTMTSWKPSTFNHNTSTTFPLTGGHIGVDCIKCHTNGYTNTASTCVSCHLKDYNATTNPNHVTAKFSTECQTCHNVTSWKPSTFNHNTSTTFPLTGGHVGVDCIKCHTNGYTNTSTACVSCHQKDYNATTNPNHVTAKFSTECQTCHNVTAWKPSTFNHNTSTTFPLTGGHVGVDCIKCHTNGYTNTSTACVSCHQKDYNATTNPNHLTAKFSTECQTCHTMTSWKPSTFNHNTSTTFPLTGGHVGIDCIKCHTNGYTNTASTCVSCHLKDYNATTNPNHVTAKFSTECQTCHNVTAWKPSTFNHNTSTTFPLTGGHVGVDCIKCHTNGYINTSKACVSCHLADYNSTTNPAHATAKFPTTCETCHTVTTWSPSTFKHDSQYFKIYSGKHRGRWSKCTECHTTASNFGTFSCIACHEHSNKSSVDSEHRGVSGYVYSATSCFSCHPRI